jgi:hypothetical protein
MKKLQRTRRNWPATQRNKKAALRIRAENQLDKAARLIVERVVNS